MAGTKLGFTRAGQGFRNPRRRNSGGQVEITGLFEVEALMATPDGALF